MKADDGTWHAYECYSPDCPEVGVVAEVRVPAALPVPAARCPCCAAEMSHKASWAASYAGYRVLPEAREYVLSVHLGDVNGDAEDSAQHLLSVQSNQPSMNEAAIVTRRAFLAAVTKYPHLDPRRLCNERIAIPLEWVVAAEAAGLGTDEFSVDTLFALTSPHAYMRPCGATLAMIVTWFINLGDPTLRARPYTPEHAIVTDFDAQGRLGFGFALFPLE